MPLSFTPIAYYDFTEGSGTVLTDRQSGTYNGTLGLSGSNIPTWSNHGLTFNNETVALPPALWSTGKPVTIHWCLSVADNATYQTLLWNDSNSVNTFLVPGGCQAILNQSAGPDVGTTQPMAGNHMLTITIGSTPRLYWDGVEVKGYYAQSTAFTAGYVTPTQLWLGFFPGPFVYSGTMWFNAYFTQELSPSQVAADYAVIAPTITSRGVTAFGVDSQASLPLFYCRGDSITAGVGAMAPLDWPYLVWQALGTSNYRLSFCGNGGETIVSMIANMSRAVGSLTIPSGSIAFLEAGTSDYASTTSAQVAANVATLYSQWVTGYDDLKAAGFGRVIVPDLLPRQDAPTGDGFPALRIQSRALLVADTHHFDALCNWGTDANIGQDDSPSNPTYYISDLTHPNPAGNVIMAGYAETAATGPLRTGSSIPIALLFQSGGY